MKFKAMIFDLDGTLVDSLQDIADSVNHALMVQGYDTFSTDQIRQHIGHGLDTLIKDIAPSDKKNNEKWIAHTLELTAKKYSESWQKNSHLFLGIEDVLDSLTIANIPMAIISNKPEPFTKAMVKLLLSKWDFVATIGSRALYPLKPNPLSTLATIKKFMLQPEEVAFIGDGETDIKTALASGITPIAVTWGFRKKEELKIAGASIFIDKPAELLTYITH